MKERRIYPRISAAWPIYLEEGQNQQLIGELCNISLNGLRLAINIKEVINIDEYTFNIKLTNPKIKPPELEIQGKKKWIMEEEKQIIVGLEIDDLNPEAKVSLVHYLSRNDEIKIEIFLKKN
ncbi:MAG: PilZ domain-containing protein [Spirochaetes bacterium]|nr:PilZ domain-containing protein [Spirochaetota bacterium]